MTATPDRPGSVRRLACACLVVAALALAGCGQASRAAGQPVLAPPTPEAPVGETPPPPSPSPVESSPPAATTPPPNDLSGVQVRLTQVAELEVPIDLAVRAGDDATLWIAERGGLVRALRGGAVDPVPLLDLSGEVATDGERGLLGITFSPDGGRLYAYFTAQQGNVRVDEWTLDGAVVRPDSRRTLFDVEHPRFNHNGGTITFGPDGLLYLGLGDGGGQGDPAGNGQALNTLLGKILRVDPTPSGGLPYTIPPDNPFVGQADARPEIWAYGLRNPWRWSFDRDTGDVWVADVGEQQIEEVSVVAPEQAPGANYGWSLFEGSQPFAAPGGTPLTGVEPIAEYEHSDGSCSITGGYVYRGQAIPALRGAYVFGDFCVSGLQAIVESEGRLYASTDLGVDVESLISFGEDAAGELYALSFEGPVYRLDQGP